MNVLVDDIGLVIAAMRETSDGPPYYMYGHRLEISKRLDMKKINKDLSGKLYPLFALRMDFSEDVFGGTIHYRLNIAIVTYTSQNYNAEQRYEEVFKPVLYPLYEDFLANLKTVGKFTWEQDLQVPRHTKIDRPYFGITSSEGNKKRIFNDPLDAIEITDLEINQRIKNC